MNLTFFYQTDMRNFLNPSLRFVLCLCLGCFLMVSCENQVDPIDNPIPVDEPPAITIISPTNPRFSKRVGEQVSVTFQMADNEELQRLRVSVSQFGPDDVLVSQGLETQQDLDGNTFVFNFTATVDTIPAYSKLAFKAVVTDSKGASDSTSFCVSVLPGPDSPQPYQLLVYENDTIFNAKTDMRYGFNLTSRRAIPEMTGQDFNTIVLQLDIAENSGTGQGLWLPQIYSPNNEETGVDSSIVITNMDRFNYEEATYNSIFSAFASAETYYEQTPALQEGDYVIVRLIKTPRPQFAVMHIKELVDDGPGINVSDYFVFDYKVSTP